jgi:pimeloyl-ACP methyl ester carboxylesterase
MPFYSWQPIRYSGVFEVTTMNMDRRAFVMGAASGFVAVNTCVAAQPSGTKMQSNVQSFKIDISDETLSSLAIRVRDPRLPLLSRGAGWKYGVDSEWFAQLVTYWGHGFDWRKAERTLNRHEHFRADVEGRKVHFVRMDGQASKTQIPLPIVLLHGWPYTFATMIPLGERLAAAGFQVLIPSLPGSIFSETPDDQIRGLRFGSRRIGRLLTEVLGYPKYILHGGDHGAVVADWLAIDSPNDVAGIHTNMIAFRHAGAEYGSGETGVPDAAPEEIEYAKAEVARMEQESAYFRLQNTRPETITYSLSDSPVGWAAYMLDKWQKWTDTKKRPFDKVYDRDRLLTEVMLFLVTNSVATSIWPYAGFALEPFGLQPGHTIDVPFGHSSFDDPLLPRMPRAFVARSRKNIRLWKEHSDGGHFPMLEQTEVLAKDIIEFAQSL